MKKGLSVFTAVTTTLWLLGAAFLVAPAALAVIPADYGLTEGDVISAWDQAGDPDVYIVNDHGYKRLFLNPAIFGFYGHLGFDKVVQISSTTRDAFGTSGLFRNCEAGDEKVYGVETTGEDTGMLHWVNMPGSAAVAEDADFFKKVFCINNNEFNWYTSNGTSFGSDYTSLSQVPDYERGETGVVTGPVSLSIAPGNPAARTLTYNAQGVEVLRIRLTGTGTVQSLMITRGGAGDTNDFDNVYVYDGNTRLTSGRSISSTAGTTTFINLDVAVNGTKDVSILADLGSGYTVGNVHTFEVSAAGDVGLAGGLSAGGSFPVRGNVMSISGAAGGAVTIERNGSISNPTVGQVKAEISQFRLTTTTEAGVVKRMRFINAGTVNDSSLTNIVVETLAGVQVATGEMSGDGYMDLTFSGNGYRIAKGDNQIFQVYANIGGKKAETIDLYLETDADTLMMGEQFGFGVAVSDDDIDQASDVTNLVLQGGDLNITFLGPNATNVGTNVQDTHLIDFKMDAAKDIELRRHEVVLCADIAGDGAYDVLDTNFSDLEDIKIVNTDTGTILVGPVDGSSFELASASAAECGGQAGLYYAFTDAMDVPAGQTLNLALTADVKTANTSDSSTALVNGSVFRAILTSYADLAGPDGVLTVAKYAGTNIALAAAQIIPSGDITSNTKTISTTGLTLGLAGSPVDKSVVKGTQDVEAVAITMRASLASAVTVKRVTISARSGTTSGTTATSGAGSLVNSLDLYDADTGAKINATVISNTLSTDNVQFDNLNWLIPAGETKTLLVKANLSTNAIPTNVVFALDIDATADITALDESGQTVTVTGADPNGATSPIVDVTVTSAGSMTAALSPSSPSTGAVYWGQQGVEVARFRYAASNEAFLIEKLTFGASGSDGTEVADMTANVKSFTLEFTNKAGNPVTKTLSLSSAASANFGFSGDDRPYVPKDSSIDIVVKANMKTRADGATNAVTFDVKHMASYNGSVTNAFRAVGEGSGTVLTGDSAGVGREVDSNAAYVYRVYPKISIVATTAGEPLGTKDVAKFTVEAMGLSDSKLFFDGGTDANSGSIVFEAVADPTTSNTLAYTVYDVSDGSVVDTGDYDEAGIDSMNASLSIDFGTTGTGKDIEIAGGSSKTFRIEMNFTGFTSQSDYFQLILRDEAGTVNWVANSDTNDAYTANVAGIIRNLPMNAPTFSKL